MYAVSIAPSSSIRCEQRSIIWRLCFPAARNKLMANYGPTSVPNKVLSVLNTMHSRINQQVSELQLQAITLRTRHVISHHGSATIVFQPYVTDMFGITLAP